jgi:predicted permease
VIGRWVEYLLAMWNRKQREQDLDRELRSHLDLETEELRQDGLSPRDAHYAAQRAFGSTTLIKEDIRAMWTWASFEQLAKDLRYALRTIRSNAAFSTAAILSLALGIGANTAIFSLIDALLLRSLPVRNPAELVQLQFVEQGRLGSSFGYPTIGALAGLTEIFEGVCGFSSFAFNVTSQEGSERVTGAWVTGGYYPTLGLAPYAGRLITPEDDRPGAPPVVVLSYSYWETRFARDFGVVGRSIQLEGKPVSIVGVSPRGFTGANVGDAANLTLSLAVVPQLFPERAQQLESGSQWLRVLARPRSGVSTAQARARLAVVWPQMATIATTPRMNAKRRQVILASSIDLVPGATGYSTLRDQFRRPLLVLMAVTGLVLLIACANFANLLLARGAARSKEIALRFAIGAGRGRIVRQLLMESLTLSSMGAVLGIALATIGSRLLVTLMPGGRRIELDLKPDAEVLLFTCAVALATGILFGLAPALRATAVGPGAALKADAGITPRTRSRLLPALVVSQVAFSLVLLIAPGCLSGLCETCKASIPVFAAREFCW